MTMTVLSWVILGIAAGLSVAGGVVLLFGLREQERADVAYAAPAGTDGHDAWYGHSRWAVHYASFGAALGFVALAFVAVVAMLDPLH